MSPTSIVSADRPDPRRPSRRVALAGFTVAVAGVAGRALAAPLPFTVYRTAACACCEAWIAHMLAAGYRPASVVVDDLAPIRRRYGVPDDLASCHTASVGPYVLEGHVRATDLTTLLRQAPAAVGLAAPGMPAGSPGMERPDGVRDAYATVLMLPGGARRTFATH